MAPPTRCTVRFSAQPPKLSPGDFFGQFGQVTTIPIPVSLSKIPLLADNSLLVTISKRHPEPFGMQGLSVLPRVIASRINSAKQSLHTLMRLLRASGHRNDNRKSLPRNDKGGSELDFQ